MNHSLLSISLLFALAACNQPPTGGAVSIRPEKPASHDDLVAAITDFSVDPNSGDNVDYIVIWKLDGSEVMELADSMTVESTWTSVGQEWTVSVTPRDNKSFGVPFSTTVTVVNSTPTIAELRLEPSSPREGDTVKALFRAEDTDGDKVVSTYAWFVNDRDIGQSNDSLSSDYFDKGDSILVKVTPSDGHVEGEPITSSTIRAVNTPPQISAARINPTVDAEVDSLFTCEPQGWSDPDGDSAEYQHKWYVNGDAVSTEASIATPDFVGGDLVYCEITPDDGDDLGPSKRSEQVQVALPPRDCDPQAQPKDPYIGKAFRPDYVYANTTFAYDASDGKAREWCSDDGLEPLAINVTMTDERYTDSGPAEYLCAMRLVPALDRSDVEEHLFSFDIGSGEVKYDHHGFTFESGSFTVEDYTYENANGDIIGGCLSRTYDASKWGTDLAMLFEDQDWGMYVGEMASEIEALFADAVDDPADHVDAYDLYYGDYIFGGSQQASKYVGTGPLLYGLAYEVDSQWFLRLSHDEDDPYVRLKASTAVPGNRSPATGIYSLYNYYVWRAGPLLVGR
ncbi:MAG: hypothetical protein ACI9MC_002978 [Kiritimatiellia bacterium]|jgi:hypothetical protein